MVTGRSFTMNELHGGSEGMKCEHKSNCVRRTWSIFLSDEDLRKLNEKFPQDVEDGMARGGEASLFILQKKLGQALCEKHSNQ